MKKITSAIAAFVLLWSTLLACAQTTGLPLIPLGYCQLFSGTVGGWAVSLQSCVRASFTASGRIELIATRSDVGTISGTIKNGGDRVNATGVTAGTTIVSQASGTPGGAGTYNLSATNTASSASATSGGIPPNANEALLESDTAAVRFRDDGGAPTASVGQPIRGECAYRSFTRDRWRTCNSSPKPEARFSTSRFTSRHNLGPLNRRERSLYCARQSAVCDSSAVGAVEHHRRSN